MSQSDLAAASASNGDQNGDKEHLPTGLVCPFCHSKLVRRSMRRTFKDRFLTLFGKWPYRCQMCNMRFHGPKTSASITRGHADSHEDDLPDEGHPPEVPGKPKD